MTGSEQPFTTDEVVTTWCYTAISILETFPCNSCWLAAVIVRTRDILVACSIPSHDTARLLLRQATVFRK